MFLHALIQQPPIKIKTINITAVFLISFVIGGCKIQNKNIVDSSLANEDKCENCWELEKGLMLEAKGGLETGVKYFLGGHSVNGLQELPEFLGNKMGVYWDTQNVAYEDINHDGKKDIIILARYITGIGPSGSEPFQVSGFYLNTNVGFRQDVKNFTAANNEIVNRRIINLEKLILFLNNKFK